MAIVILGAYIFLAKDVLSGHLIGIGLLLVAEMAFAYGNVSNRLIALNHTKDVSPVVNLIGNVIGAAVLVPMALLQGDWERVLTLPGWMWGLLVVLGLVYAYSGVLWGKLLDKLRVVEVSVLANTMIIQVAVLSVIFLGESISAHNVLGGAVVIVGALLVDGALFYKKLRT